METHPSFTGRRDCHVIRFSQEPPPFLQWLKIIIKKYRNIPPFPLYYRFSISSPSPPRLLLCRCPLCLLAFHLLPFPWCFSPPLRLLRPTSLSPLSPQSISLQWSGRLTAAPPEEYQSMLLWRQNQAPPPLFSTLLSFFFYLACARS